MHRKKYILLVFLISLFILENISSTKTCEAANTSLSLKLGIYSPFIYKLTKYQLEFDLHNKTEIIKLFDKEEGSNEEEISPPKRLIDPNKPMIALTFDDGPSKKTSQLILNVLKEHDSLATFFILGSRVSDNVDFLKEMVEAGNEIGNHSYNHKDLSKLSSEELRRQIIDTQDTIFKATGYEVKLTRPTYGAYNNKLKVEVDMPLILWSVDTLDWKNRDAEKIIDHVLRNARDGDIIIMHDIYETTAQAVQVLVPKLREMGYQLVTVSELFESRGEVLEKGKVYFSKRK